MRRPRARLVVDTDVASFLFRDDDTRGDLYRPHVAGQGLAISFMTLAELRLWPVLNRWGAARRRDLEAHVRQFTVIHSDEDLTRWWASTRAAAQRKGRRIRVADAWDAATALLYRVPLVTHNAGDFAGVPGLTIITEKRLEEGAS